MCTALVAAIMVRAQCHRIVDIVHQCWDLCIAQVHAALTKATGQLLDDLNRNARLLGTPERCVDMTAYVLYSQVCVHATSK